MQRGEFLYGIAALGPSIMVRYRTTAEASRPVKSDDKADPAQSQNLQALRVLLGKGSANRLDNASFEFEGRRYRGDFAQLDDGHVVNTVPLEHYLYSVVPREMPPSWPQPALQAQATIARTFVLQRSSPNRQYDLVPSEADQVYTGMDSEHAASSAAVDFTAGQVLRFGDGFALAMYSSCCGGHTEASIDAWNGKPVDYLNGVPCTYCAPAPWYSWKQNIAYDHVQTALAKLLPQGFVADRVALDQIDASGRPKVWLFESDGEQIRVPAPKIRSALGGRVLPSLRVRKVDVGTQAPRTLSIEGGGLGHGVGLCQWGAWGLALTGADAAAILRYYYPGTELGND